MAKIGQASAPLILTIDMGSSSVRALLFDTRGNPVAGMGARQPYDLAVDTTGASEDQPKAAIARFVACVDQLLDQAGSLAQQIVAVAIDTMASTFLALDAAHQPLTPIISYADTRNDADADQLRHSQEEHAIHQRTGCLLRTSYWPARLAWLRRTQPLIWQQAAHYLTLGEYLELELFGTCRAGYSPASWTGLLNRQELAWDTELLDALGITASQLSPLTDTNQPLRGLREPYAKRWPALAQIPWFPAIGDGAAANIGSGCTGPQRIALTVGTTGALRVVRPSVAMVPAGLWCYRVDGKRALLGGATSEGGNVYAWLQRTMQLGDPSAAEAALAAREPNCHGLMVLPFWAGERSPGWAGNARASIVGMTMATNAIDILQASLEAVAYRFALIAEGLFEGSTTNAQIVVSGGSLSQSPAWAQIVANVLGRPLVLSQEPEATSRGVALLALEALGIIRDIAELPARDGSMITPNMQYHEHYRQALAEQQVLYAKLIA
jgi:gluconokinase